MAFSIHHSAPECTKLVKLLAEAVGAGAEEFEEAEVAEDLELLADFVADIGAFPSLNDLAIMPSREQYSSRYHVEGCRQGRPN